MVNNSYVFVCIILIPVSLVKWVKFFIHGWRLPLMQKRHFFSFFLSGRERNHHLHTSSWSRRQNSAVQCSVELSSLDAPKLPSIGEPQTPVNAQLFPVMTTGAHPDLSGPPRHEADRTVWRSFWWPKESMGTEQVWLFSLLLLNPISNKLQNDNLMWLEWD